MNKNKGFTLIELLVVIAIIGILSSVVVALLSSAKNKGNDIAVKSGLNQARIQADLFFTTGGVYTGVCDPASNTLTPRGINNMVLTSGKANGYLNPVSYNGSNSINEVKCNSAVNGWAAQIPLKNETGYYCVDYTRKGIVTSTSIGDSYAYCQ